MCLPLVTWSSVALATPNTNSNKMQPVVLIISGRRIKFCAFTVEMFSKVRFRLNQSDSPECVKAEMTKNEILWNVNETAQALHSRLLVSSVIY